MNERIKQMFTKKPVGPDEWRRLPRARKAHLWTLEGAKVYRSLCGAVVTMELDDPVADVSHCKYCEEAKR